MNKFVLESKPNDGRYGTPDIWRAETLPLTEEEANKTLEQRRGDVTKYDGVADFEYRLVELKEDKPKKKKKKGKKA